MLSFALAVLTATPCVVIDGKPECGDVARDLVSRGLFAQTPYGRCTKSAGGQVLCFDPPTHVIRAYNGKPPEVQCLWNGDNGACGFDCKKQGDAVACAKSPRGTCEAKYDKVVCADPPPAVFGVFKSAAPKPTCVAREGAIACGYNCAWSPDLVSCAKTPFGQCANSSRGLQCFDPSDDVICTYGKETPKPSCDLEGCGYNCHAGVCTKTPKGTCDRSTSTPVCIDPPLTNLKTDCAAMLAP